MTVDNGIISNIDLPCQAIELKHRDIFKEYQKNDPPRISEINFTNLFIWQDFYRAHFFEAHGCLCILAHPPINGLFGLPPIGSGDKLKALEKTLEVLKSQNVAPVINRVPESLAQQAASLNLTATEDRDNSDYIYLTESIATLAGRKMHQKKNHYNYFKNNYDFECLALTPEMVPEIKDVQDSWLEAKIEQLGAEQLAYEDETVTRALDNYKALELWGMGIRVNGRLEAFTIGEPLNNDTFLVHIEKANPNIRGLFVALASSFAASLPKEFVYLNREQDLGLPGLRQAKESYKPESMVVKYSLTAK